MNNMYKIVWYSKITEAQGEGKPVFDTREAAQRYAERMNAKYPQIHHDVM